MLTVKYSKNKSASFISHIDMLRVLNRIFKRADLKAKYSVGFNPHMLMFMSSPLPLGTDSQAEYVSVDSLEILNKEKFNKYSVNDIQAEEIFYTEKNPNIAGVACASSFIYKDCFMNNLEERINEIKNAASYTISYVDRENETIKDVRSLILDINVSNNNIQLLLCSGNYNLRADRLLSYFLKQNNLEFKPTNLMRTAQFVKNGNSLVNIDDYLVGLK